MFTNLSTFGPALSRLPGFAEESHFYAISAASALTTATTTRAHLCLAEATGNVPRGSYPTVDASSRIGFTVEPSSLHVPISGPFWDDHEAVAGFADIFASDMLPAITCW